MKKSAQVKEKAHQAASTEQWRRLYEVAAELKRAEPWSVLWDADIVTIQLPDQEEPVFCSVMGQGGACFGIGVYPGYDAFSRLHRLMSEDRKSPSGMDAFEQKCLMCYYGDREEIEPRDRAVMQELGLKFRGRNQWIFFRALEPGYLPWFLDAEQVRLLTDALENLAMAFDYLLRGDIQVDFEGGETLLRFYSEERGEWLNTAIQFPPLPVQQCSLHLKDELLLARLKKQKKRNVALEIDSFYLPTPVQERKDEVPYLPRMTILADRTQGMLLDQHMAQPDEGPKGIPLDILVDYIETHGRPSAVYVRDDRIASILTETCAAIGVSLIAGEGMPTVDAFFEDMLDFMC